MFPWSWIRLNREWFFKGSVIKLVTQNIQAVSKIWVQYWESRWHFLGIVTKFRFCCYANPSELINFSSPFGMWHINGIVFPVGSYMFKVNNRSTRTRYEICSKLTIKTPEWRHWRRSGVFIVNFEHIPHLALVFLWLTLSR